MWIQRILPVTINYRIHIKTLIRAGRYDWGNGNIPSKYFPPERQRATATLNALIINFSRYILSAKILAELKGEGFRAGTLKELLTLGAAYPDEQRADPIVALGSVRPDLTGGLVPYLYGSGLGRGIDLRSFGDWWNGDYRLLAFAIDQQVLDIMSHFPHV